MPRPIFTPGSGRDRFGRAISGCAREIGNNRNPSSYEIFAYKRSGLALVARLIDIKVCAIHRASAVPEVDVDELVGYDVLF